MEWSDEDRCYIGTCPGLFLGGVHGDDEAKVYRELCQVVEEWIKIYQEDNEPLPEPTAGKDYSGKFVVRVGPELHKKLSIEALRSGRSLNAYCVDVLRESGVAYGKQRRGIPPSIEGTNRNYRKNRTLKSSEEAGRSRWCTCRVFAEQGTWRRGWRRGREVSRGVGAVGDLDALTKGAET